MLLEHVLTSLILVVLFDCLMAACPRERSKLVRNMLKKHVLPIYSEFETNMPSTCPVSKERDVFGEQEVKKIEETPSKWQCDYCGKQFFSEYFLDKHMDLKHADKLKREPDTTCLADYCDIFRCDVISAQYAADYWTKALCKEDELIGLKKTCHELLEPCVPRVFEAHEEKQFRAKLYEVTCNFLTCEKVYEKLDSNEKNVSLVIYIVALIFLIFSLIIYYVIAYTHFYEEPIFDSHHRFEDDDETEENFRYYTQTKQQVRSRYMHQYAGR
ncbi:uncharacterized protein LOC135495880 [Lineus longissimus]|uniref:uncharacterized protein LOC135495880 n=1 Tax=Lineus longissimus TaxID=88925 RepID=UPI002B4C3AD8